MQSDRLADYRKYLERRADAVELNEALAHIAVIRQQLARTETFRGFRSLTVGFSGLTAFAAAAIQSVWIADPRGQLHRYVGLWVAAAAISLLACGAHLLVRYVRLASISTRHLTALALGQFLPCLAAGALVTMTIVTYAASAAWMLPGLWATMFSLGVFATFRLLARPLFWVGAYYLSCGVFSLCLGPELALHPWTMGLVFGVGQLTTAALLYFYLERHDESVA